MISSITSIPINLSFFLTVIILFSKSGRPLIKKMSERKGNARPRHISSNAQLDSPGKFLPYYYVHGFHSL